MLAVQADRTQADARDQTLQLIQFVGPVQEAWVDAVEKTGAKVIHYAGSNGYLIWVGESASKQIDRLAAKNTFIGSTAPLEANQKIDRGLPQTSDAGTEIMVTIQMLRHDNQSQTEKLIESLSIKRLGDWEPVLNYQNLQAEISTTNIEKIARLPDVVWIGAFHSPELMDERQGQILAGNLDPSQTMPAGPGYIAWLMERGFSNEPEKYPIIDITDDGIGTGFAATAAGDSTLRIAGDPSLSSRLIYLKNCTTAPDASGPNGHGHINASIAAGYDSRVGEPYQDSFDYHRGVGTNPFGRLAGTRVFNGSIFEFDNCDSSYLSLLRQSYQAGARIINNSWGCTVGNCTSEYTPAAQLYDTAVRDADQTAPGNQELLILFSAGNEGRPASVGSPANAKNVLTVGASENVRPTWTDACGIGPTQADNLQDVWIRSSRGPAPGGRVKPDLVAPGTHVTGTASPSPFYNGSNICNKYFPLAQQTFTASSGTSHSVPAVAGLTSLASHWLSEKFGRENPSPALLKAYLVANTRYLTGNDASDDLPSNNQGYGLPDLGNAFDNKARIIFDQENFPRFDKSGESMFLIAQAADNTLPVRVVMAFTDQPMMLPNPFNDPLHPRVNDLDLIVKTSGKTYHGNNMEGQWSKTGGAADPVNTIEAVFLPAGTAAALEIQIVGTLIAGDGVPGVGDITDQDFVLVCDNCKATGPESYTYRNYLPLLTP